MKIQQYDPTDMSLLSSDVTGVDFGSGVAGQHCPNVIAIKPTAETETFQSLALFLEDNSGMDHTQFGKYKSSSAIPGITAGSDYLSDYLIEVEGISDAMLIPQYSDQGIVFDAGSPEYAWLDAGIGLNETTLGSNSINLRFVFEYN